PLIALFTSHDPVQESNGGVLFETQSLAYSLDDGRTWTKYAGNPVLNNPGQRDFRDPKVMWYAPENKWVMVLAAHDRIDFYSSQNLIRWTKESEFGTGHGAHGGVWECPDLIEVGDKQWVLLVSINPGGPNSGSATQYFVGNFDGRTFVSSQQDTRWLDYGPDNYAGVTWSNTGARQIMIGWMSNWQYAQEVPTDPWRGAMTVPQELGLKMVDGSLFVTSQPVAELDTLFGKPVVWQDITVNKSLDLSPPLQALSGRFRLTLVLPQAEDWSIKLSNLRGEQVLLGYEAAEQRYFLDRSQSGNVSFEPSFAHVARAPRIASEAFMEVTLLVDSASAELFADGGLTCLTGVFFPSEPLINITLQTPRSLPIQRLTCTVVSSMKNTETEKETRL
ncbi:MAG: glycoside hydrolase family 32 protein, partial [Janthinobacterium lividum]